MPWSGPAFTPVTIPAVQHRVHYADKIFLTGSCFSENISEQLKRYKYKVLDNPFGILYNPVSMAVCLDRIVHQQHYTAEALVEHDGLFHSMDHHGVYSGIRQEDVLERINHSIESAADFLKDCRFFFISPGTATVYSYKQTGAITGNCHKIPQDQFEKSTLSVKQCVQAFEKIIACIRQVSPNASIIWTVSPVRHIRDGLTENQKSKATLILALDHICKSHPDHVYFPAYEIMIDQLRDYRYYANDMVHPSPEAVQIIWEIFRDAYLDAKEIDMHSQIEKVHQAMQHRFLHPRVDSISKFATKNLELIRKLSAMNPSLNWDAEKEYFTILANDASHI